MADPAFLLDANTCVYILDGVGEALRRRVEAARSGALVTSAIAYAEVMIGAARREAITETRRLFDMIPVLPFELSAAEAYVTLPFKRGSFDRLIAAHALALDLTLVTDNECDFADVPGLRVENWTVPS
ncbi:type II toxin-antitoxin system VapC family toxin [Hephaestia sp. GCM10023244]|uniref:type II toxin-antitoxin system VapC family toxin n=1 Tax=unclassified Hephaestia TaxID=2631281 RepID=UPI0020779AC5|nr:type II toxin-antitoxin system VapC family toxin [Hephaestia sp. MAHUQ-44]